jgi:hypothetical protein
MSDYHQYVDKCHGIVSSGEKCSEFTQSMYCPEHYDQKNNSAMVIKIINMYLGNRSSHPAEHISLMYKFICECIQCINTPRLRIFKETCISRLDDFINKSPDNDVMQRFIHYKNVLEGKNTKRQRDDDSQNDYMDDDYAENNNRMENNNCTENKRLKMERI